MSNVQKIIIKQKYCSSKEVQITVAYRCTKSVRARTFSANIYFSQTPLQKIQKGVILVGGKPIQQIKTKLVDSQEVDSSYLYPSPGLLRLLRQNGYRAVGR